MTATAVTPPSMVTQPSCTSEDARPTRQSVLVEFAAIVTIASVGGICWSLSEHLVNGLHAALTQVAACALSAVALVWGSNLLLSVTRQPGEADHPLLGVLVTLIRACGLSTLGLVALARLALVVST